MARQKIVLIDTGGIELKTSDVIPGQMRLQAELAIDMADAIIFMVDVKTGLTSADKDVAAMLVKSGKPIVLVCNKVDNVGDVPMEFYEFYNLGLDDPIAISSVHGLGTGDLLDKLYSYVDFDDDADEDDDAIKVAVIGKPNVGKSSLINRILGENRVIVSDVAGTTRDAIDTPYEYNGQKYIFIDTAGMRKRGKIDENIERYSVVRSLAAVDRCDVVLIMIDAEQGVTEQDTKIAGYAHDNGKASIVTVNKWDLIDKNTHTMENYRNDVQRELAYMTYAPVAFLSAKTGARVGKIFELINYVSNQHAMRISTGVLNDVLNEAITKVQPPSDKGKRLKIYYMTQACAFFVYKVHRKSGAHGVRTRRNAREIYNKRT